MAGVTYALSGRAASIFLISSALHLAFASYGCEGEAASALAALAAPTAGLNVGIRAATNIAAAAIPARTNNFVFIAFSFSEKPVYSFPC